MVEGEKVISNELEVANILNTFFENAISNLGISQANEYIVNGDYILDPIIAIIIKYSEHPSILQMKEIASWPTITFNLYNMNEIENEIIKMKAKTSVFSEHGFMKVVPKEEPCTCKELFRPISVLPAGSKFSKEFSKSKSVPTLIRICVDIEKLIMLNMPF